MRHGILIALLACAGCSSSRVSPAVTLDAECYLITSSMAAHTSDPDEHTRGLAAAWYYIGKLRVEAPDLDMNDAIPGVDLQGSGDTLFAHRQQCVAEVREASTRMTAAAQALKVPKS